MWAPKSSQLGPISALFQARPDGKRRPAWCLYVVLPMNDRCRTVIAKNPMRLEQQTHRVFDMQNVKQHDEAYRARRSTTPRAHEVALFYDDIARAHFSRARCGRPDHRRIDVQCIEGAGYPGSQGNRESAISAAEFHSIATHAVTSQRVENVGG